MDDLISLFDKVFLLKANQKVLSVRLTTRTSNDFGRAPEVQKHIFSLKGGWEDKMVKKGAEVINANRDIKGVAQDIVKRIKL